MNSIVILLPSADSRRVVVSYKRKHVHEVLVNCLVKLDQEKSVVRWTDRSNMTIAADWDVKQQTKPNQKHTFSGLEISYIKHFPCITKIIGIHVYGENVNLH